MLTIFSRAMSGVIIFLLMSENNFSTTSNSFTYRELNRVVIFKKYHTKRFYPDHIVFIILVSLFMNIRCL